MLLYARTCKRRPARDLRVLLAAAAGSLTLLGAASPALASRLVYVSNGGANSVSAFSAGATGALTPIGAPVATGGSLAEGVAIRHEHLPSSGDGAYLYVANFSSSGISTYAIGDTGALTPRPAASTGANTAPMGLAVTPDGRRLYASIHTSTIQGFDIRPDGTLASIGSTPACPTSCGPPFGIAISPNGFLYTANEGTPGSVSAFRIESNGALTPVGSPVASGGNNPIGVDVNALGDELFVANATPGSNVNNNVQAFSIAANGALTPIGAVAVQHPVGVAAAPDGVHVYVTNKPEGSPAPPPTVQAFAVTSARTLSPIGSAPTGPGPQGLALLPGSAPSLYVGNDAAVPGSVSAFAIASNGVPSPIATTATGASSGPNLFSVAATITNADVVFRNGSSLAFRAHPGRVNNVTIGRGSPAASFVSFRDPAPRAVTPAPGSGCLTSSNDQALCSMAGTSSVSVLLFDDDDRINSRDGFSQGINCGSGFDVADVDLLDTNVFQCEQVFRSPVDTGSPARPVDRTIRVRRGRAVTRLACRKGREGGRCRGRLALRRSGRRIGRARYSIAAGRRRTVRVPVATAIRRRVKALLLARERAADKRPMTTRAEVFLAP